MMDFNKKTEYEKLSFTELADVCSECRKCALCETRTSVVIGYGPVPCNLMVIGEAPGEQEDLSGKPFTGKAGKLLTKMFESIDIERDRNVYITNTVKCRPPKNRDPQLNEIENCHDYLIRQIQLVKPKLIILLGAPSLKTVLDSKLSISKARGKWYLAGVDYMKEPLYILPTFHPSYLLRQQSREKGSPKWLAWQDMKEVKIAYDYYSTA
ncbi:MAG: uracil-DNA glycosylase [bacterium]|nr:uracil-DNA glycosylase [bacterium]